ncbi:uncharacterized protein MICPUCDRAFT_55378 [Micromonas pusilla CCMP1545]|uniref:Predicted protein n=1 Tax=Micromonas pusilla (strain CCMP1545) TaxID=564608 RepID=C1MKL3_MICPC|nr:uncharacterized protein MICPUCDRAFT_55378 [Micromonas pusilla CCMP1545]EEH59393.1 predicted protein [Micromonas pusilla CCMP1545]|eukprot:XP_003056017.1 predicted protein [Micromonas pusilla CCMP1545]
MHDIFLPTGASPDISSASSSREYLKRQGVLEMFWSKDDPALLAFVERSRLYIFRGSEPEEPVTFSGCICSFTDLEIKAVIMEDIMRSPYDPCRESIVKYETKSLRDTRQLLKSAKQSLLQGNMFIANKAFTRCSDFYGIQLLLGAGIKEARTAAYLRKFDEAEKLYLVANRRDLAVGLRAQLGDWFKVERYIPDSTSCTITSKEALHNIGNYYFERRRWIKATGYYLRAGNLEKLLKCFYAVEDFVEFVRLLPNFHEGCRELSDIGVLLGSVGLCKDAVFAFSRGKNIKKANNVCSLLGDWGQAAVYAQHLLQNEMVVDTMQFYRRANKHKEFFLLTRQLARSRRSRRLNPLFVKKLYVFIAHEAAQNQSQTIDYEDTLMQTSPFDDIWQCAEAQHFWLLAHRQLHSGQYEYATRTSLALQGSKEQLDSADLYSFIALSSYFTRHYGNCSKAMTKLGPIIKVSRQKFNSFVDITTTVFLRVSIRHVFLCLANLYLSFTDVFFKRFMLQPCN